MTDISDVFVQQCVLKESGRNSFYKNIVFLSQEDKKYVTLMGQCMFEGFSDTLVNEIKKLSKVSYLYKSLVKESGYRLEDHKRAWFKDNNFTECDSKGTAVIGTINDDAYKPNTPNVYTLPLRHENLIVYFPALRDWLKYYIPNMANEPFETREIIKSTYIPVHKYADKHNILLNVFNHDLIESYKESIK